MEVKHAGPSLGIGMTLKEVTLVSRASSGKPARILINKATLGLSLLSHLGGTKAFNVSADLFGGDVDVTVKLTKNETPRSRPARK